MFKSLTTNISIIYKIIYKKITEAWDATYPLTVKTSAVKHIRNNTKKHNSFLSHCVLFFKYSNFSPYQKLLISFPSNQLPSAGKFLRPNLKVFTTSVADDFYKKHVLVPSPKQVFSDPTLLLFQDEFLWFGQVFFSTEAFPARLNELRLLIKSLSLLDPYKSQVFAQTKNSLFQMSWHQNTLFQSIGIHYLTILRLEQQSTENP